MFALKFFHSELLRLITLLANENDILKCMEIKAEIIEVRRILNETEEIDEKLHHIHINAGF